MITAKTGNATRAFADASSGKAKLLTYFLISLVLLGIDLLFTCGQSLQLILQFSHLELELLDFITHRL